MGFGMVTPAYRHSPPGPRRFVGEMSGAGWNSILCPVSPCPAHGLLLDVQAIRC